MEEGGATKTSTLLCQLLASAIAGASGILALAGSAVLPPVLEGAILADREFGGGRRDLQAWAISAVLFGLAALCGWIALRLVRRAASIPARQVRAAGLCLLAGTIVAAGGAELWVRRTRTIDQVLHGDALWIHRWNLRRAGEAADAGSVPLDRTDALHRHDPGLGWTPKPLVRAGGISTNSRGARGSREDAAPKPAGEKRVVAIGDSFTWGDGVADAETWPAVLETLLDGARVANLAVSGYGTDQQHLRLERDGWALEPDLVVIGFFSPNVERNALAFRDYAKPRFTVEDGRLVLSGVPVPDPADPRTSFPDPRPTSWALAYLVQRASDALARTRLAPRWEVTLAILDATAESARANGARVLLAHFPSKAAAFRPQVEDSERVLGDWAAARGVPFVNLRETFLELAPDSWGNVFHDHWTPFGNVVVARAIERAIRERGLLEGERALMGSLRVKLVLAGLTTLVSGLAAWRYLESRRAPAEPVTFVDRSDELRAMLVERQGHARSPQPVEAASDGLPRAVRENVEPGTTSKFFLIDPDRHEPDPLAYYRYRGGLAREIAWPEHPAGKYVLKTSLDGYREDFERLRDRLDLLVLVAGDSQVDGVCDNRESFPSLVEEGLAAKRPGQAVEVLNTGVGGYSFYNYLGILEKHVDRNPAVFVVAFFSGNDFQDAILPWHFFHRTAPPLRRLEYWNKLSAAIAISSAHAAMALNQLLYFQYHPDQVELAVQAAVETSGEIVRLCRRRGIALLFVHIPPGFRADGELSPVFEEAQAALGLSDYDLRQHERMADKLIGALRAWEVEVIDLRDHLGPRVEEDYWSDLHINLRGQRRIADLLLPRIEAALARR